MMWVAVVVLIVAAFLIPKLGKALLVLIGICLLLLLIAIGATSVSSHFEAQKKKNFIQLAEVEVTDLQLKSDYSMKLSGKAKNKSSKYALSKISFKLIFTDCLNKKCDIVGEPTETVYLNVPSGQTRYFEDSVYLSNMGEPNGERAWSYQVMEVEGQ